MHRATVPPGLSARCVLLSCAHGDPGDDVLSLVAARRRDTGNIAPASLDGTTNAPEVTVR